MDNVTLAHMGGEVVVLAGMAFYFNKRISALEQELQNMNKNMVATIDDMQYAINQLGAMVSKLQQGDNVSGTTSGSGRHSRPHHHSRPRATASPAVTTAQPATQKRPAPRKNMAAVEVVDPSEDEHTYDDNELDKELSQEYKELSEDRKQLRCDGDVCQITPLEEDNE